MGFGLFGKLPQKRDFMSVNLPHAVLNPFETWLQSAVAASRQEIGRNWENYFLVAPIWRFWLGKEILGTACTGCLMPSVDQVGRYFPLAIMYWAEPGETLAPPLINPIDYWYRRIEERLLAVLSDQPIDVNSLMYGLTPPDYSQPPPPPVVSPPPTFAPQPATYGEPEVEPVPEMARAAPEPEPDPEPEEAAIEPDPEPLDEPPGEEVPEAVAADETATDESEPDELGADDWDAAAEQALKIAAASLVEVETETPKSGVELESWNPEPMPADKLAALKDISAASFAPKSAGAGGASFWDLPTDHPPKTIDAAPAAPVVAAVANGSAADTGSLWDLPETEPAKFTPAAASAAPSVSEPLGVLSASAGLGGTSTPPSRGTAAPVEPVAASRAEPEPPTGAAPVPVPPPAPTPRFEPQISTTDFKGGVIAVLENVHTLGEALPQLMALDFANSAQGRSYWWCGPSSAGGPRMFSKGGLPDPYFFTRMLLWPGN